MDDQTLAAAFKLHVKVAKLHPSLKPLDLRILGAVIDAGDNGLPLAYVRTRPELFGTLTSFTPAVERLISTGFIQRLEVDYASSGYRGKGTRPPRREVVYVRTTKPIVEFVL